MVIVSPSRKFLSNFSIFLLNNPVHRNFQSTGHTRDNSNFKMKPKLYLTRPDVDAIGLNMLTKEYATKPPSPHSNQ